MRLIKYSILSYDAAIFGVLTLMVFNYMNFNMLKLGDLITELCRYGEVIFLLICFTKKTVISVSDILVLFLLAIIFLGFPDNYIGVNVLFIFFFIICTKGFSVEKIARYSLLLLGVCVFLTFILTYLGKVENIIDTVGDRERTTLGYSNANAFPTIVYSFIMLMFYQWKENYFKKYIISILLVYITFLFTDSRTLVSALLIFVFAHLLFLALAPRMTLKILSFMLLLAPIVVTQLSSYLFEDFQEIDDLLSNRLLFSIDFLAQISTLNFIVGGLSPDKIKSTVDNGFLLLQASTGTFFLCFVIWLTFRRILISINKQEPEVFSLILSFWYFSFSESSLVRPEAIMGLIFWALIYRPVIEKTKTFRKALV